MSTNSASSDATRIRALRRDLPRWFSKARRDLPWRTDRTPYRVWISELMLQQTRVETVIDYFQRFVARFPDLETLAAAPRHDVLKLWEGLGYYSRARRAHETAQRIVRDLRGRFPDTMEGLLALPGIGPYTAAAIGSLAFNLDAAVVDGNVARVLARLHAFNTDVGSTVGKRQIQAWADNALPKGRAGVFNESMMELGATVCTPRKPKCPSCPVRKVCTAFAEGNPEGYPVKAARKAVPHRHVGAAVIVDNRRRILIAQRKDDSMLGGLWEFPGGGQEPGETIRECIARELREELGITTRVGPAITTVRHAFSHFTMDLHAHWVRISHGKPTPIHCADAKWVKRNELRNYPFPKADLTILAIVEKAEIPEFCRGGARYVPTDVCKAHPASLFPRWPPCSTFSA